MLNKLFEIIEQRKNNRVSGSYTAQLLFNNEDLVLKKVGEEAVEVILAAKGQGKQRVVEEVADLFYHTLVLLASQNLTLTDVENELSKRHRTKSDHRYMGDVLSGLMGRVLKGLMTFEFDEISF